MHPLSLLLALSPLTPLSAPANPAHLDPPSIGILAAPQRFAKLSPFQAVRQNGQDYEVLFEGAWYRLDKLDGLSAEAIREHCDRRYGSKSEKRFAEDLVEVLAGMGHPTDGEVSLELRNLESGEPLVREQVKMTEANRRLVWEARKGQPTARTGRSAPAGKRIEREHSKKVVKQYAHLAAPLSWEGWIGSKTLTRKAAQDDLDQLEWAVQNTYSYRDLTGVQTPAAFDAVRNGLAEEMPLGAFATRVGQLLALYGDGHTRVRGLEGLRPTGYLPFLMEWTPDGVLAIHPSRRDFIDGDFRYLLSIDGKPLEEWLAVSRRDVAQGSEQFVRRYSLRNLRLINALRRELDLPLKETVDVTLGNGAGQEVELVLPVVGRKPGYGPWPRPSEHRLLDGNVGYLCVPSMGSEAEFLGGLEQAMESFRGTKGLVIDVRENGGGSRDALRLLLPYFLDPKDGPRVVNVGAYRLPDGEPAIVGRSYLENRSMFPRDAKSWNKKESQAIARAFRKFKPDWTPTKKVFSDWHYFVVSPGGAYHYDKPVVVLMDGGCYSATDIFLGAFKGVPGVTLMGTPSGGGSGRSQSITLEHSGLSVRLSTMASFQPDGSRYDGKGVTPDILVRPEPESFLTDGVDNVLMSALNQF